MQPLCPQPPRDRGGHLLPAKTLGFGRQPIRLVRTVPRKISSLFLGHHTLPSRLPLTQYQDTLIMKKQHFVSSWRLIFIYMGMRVSVCACARVFLWFFFFFYVIAAYFRNLKNRCLAKAQKYHFPSRSNESLLLYGTNGGLSAECMKTWQFLGHCS